MAIPNYMQLDRDINSKLQNYLSNNFCEGFRYIKARESESCIYVKCSLFRTKSCECYGKIYKSANLLEISTLHNHEAVAYNHNANKLSNTIMRRSETYYEPSKDI